MGDVLIFILLNFTLWKFPRWEKFDNRNSWRISLLTQFLFLPAETKERMILKERTLQ